MARKEKLFKPFMFADQDLDELVRHIAPPAGALAEAVAQLHAGDPSEAETILTATMLTSPADVGPWHHIVLAAIHERRGDTAGAVRALQALVDARESRSRLWAWHNLGRLGVEPEPERAARVEGVIVEVEGGRGVETLAAYADGTARYLLPTGAKVIWEAPDQRLAAAIASVIAAASELAPRLSGRGRLPGEPGAGTARMTVLTAAGARSVEEPLAQALSESSPQSALFAAATRLLDKIIEIAKW